MQAFDRLYQSLSTKQKQKFIYRLAKGRRRKTRYLDQMKCIKVEESLVHERYIKDSQKLFNIGYKISSDTNNLDTRKDE